MSEGQIMALSQTALEFARNTHYRGQLPSATHHGVGGSPGDGPYLELWLEIGGDIIKRATYRSHGCPTSMAVGAALCRLVEGRALRRAQTLTASDLAGFLGEVPEGKEFNYQLAEQAVASIRPLEVAQ
jgi:NifU-like protein involved in Fe-S cluster formation